MMCPQCKFGEISVFGFCAVRVPVYQNGAILWDGVTVEGDEITQQKALCTECETTFPIKDGMIVISN